MPAAQSERTQEARIKETERKLETEKVVHKETVEFLQRKQKQLQEDLEMWTKRYETEYGALQAEYDTLKQRQLYNRERLDYLQARKQADDDREREERELAARQA
jgi:hypothetical protein